MTIVDSISYLTLCLSEQLEELEQARASTNVWLEQAC